MTYKREYKRARRKLRLYARGFRSDGRFTDLSRHPAVVCMEMKLYCLDRALLYKDLYELWHNVLRALENLHRHTSTK